MFPQITLRARKAESTVLGRSENPGTPKLVLSPTKLALVTILSIQTLLSLCLHNTAWQDEALYLVSGRQLFQELLGGPAVAGPYAQYFGGLPCLYPILASGLDALGGLEAARLFSLVCMLGVTTATYFLARRWFDKDSALAAAALFAVQPSVLVIGRMATYDASCLLLLALATLLALHIGAAPLAVKAPLLGAILVLAVATKYGGMLFLPVVLALLAWQTGGVYGWKQAYVRVGLAVGAFMILLGLGLSLLDHSVVVGIMTTTTNRTVLGPAPQPILAGRAIALGGVVFALAIVSLLGACRRSVRASAVRPPTLVLIAAALLAPAYHLYKGEAASLEKHIGYGLFFVAPLAGATLARFGWDAQRWRIVALIFWSAVCCYGWVQARQVYTQWPNSTILIEELRSQIRPGDQIMAEEKHVPQYYLQAVTTPQQWHDLYGIEYEAHKQAGNDEAKEQAFYRSALIHGHYNLILIQYGPTPEAAGRIASAVKSSGRYDLVLQQNFESSFGAKPFWLWRLRPRNVSGWADGSEITIKLKQPVSSPQSWQLEAYAPAAAALTADGSALKVSVTEADGTDWHVQLYQGGLTVREGATYELRFRAKAIIPESIAVSANEDQNEYLPVGLEQAVPLTTKWQQFRLTFQASGVVSGEVRVPVFKLGITADTVWLSDISLRRLGQYTASCDKGSVNTRKLR